MYIYITYIFIYYICHLILITPLFRDYNLNFKDEEIENKRVSISVFCSFLELPSSLKYSSWEGLGSAPFSVEKATCWDRWWYKGSYCGVIYMEKFSLPLLVSLEWLLFAVTLDFFLSLRGIYCVFKYCIINNICSGAASWSIFHVNHPLCSTSWISSRVLPSLLLPQWQSSARRMAGLRLLIYRTDQSASRSQLKILGWQGHHDAVGRKLNFLKLNFIWGDPGLKVLSFP